MADTVKSPIDAHAIDLVTTLAKEASGVDIVEVETDGLGPGLPAKVPLILDRKDQSAADIKKEIDAYRLAPERRKGTAKVDTLQSFIDLTIRHKDSRSALFGKTVYPNPSLTAVINYDDSTGDARSRDHRIVYAFPLTEEFKSWVGNNAKPMEQEVFAAFLEEHAAELAAPLDGETSEYERLFKEKMATPSDVVSLSRHLEVHVSARAKQGIRLQTGERVVEFMEEHQNAKGEPIVVPGIFMVSVPAFIDGDPVRIPARLRYRVAGGKVMWFYQLYRWEFFLREQVGHDLKAAAKATELPAFEGAPEA